MEPEAFMCRGQGLKKFVGRGSMLNFYFLPNFFCSFLELRGAWPIHPSLTKEFIACIC
jgi:hypothetical protein